jgi:dipeptidyl aminopeptidase/acylaminoacyl peptidase
MIAGALIAGGILYYAIGVFRAFGRGIRRRLRPPSRTCGPVSTSSSTPVQDGRSVHRLTSDRTDVAVGWSPDGTKILFLRDARSERRPHRWTELWLMDADGSAQTRLQFNRTGWSVVSADWGR